MFPYLSVGPLSLPIPELSLILGFLFGSLLTDHEIKKSDLDPKLLDNLIWILFITGLIGARLSYLARNTAAFQGNFKSIISTNPALLDPVGGFLIAITSGFIYLSNKQISFWKILDGLSIFLSAMLIALNLANFASGNNYGQPTALPWGIDLWGEYRHPVQLYFLAGGFITIAIVIFSYRQRNNSSGFTFLIFSGLSSAIYLYLSRFRASDAYFSYGIRPYQVIFWVLLAFSLGLFFYRERFWIQEKVNES